MFYVSEKYVQEQDGDAEFYLLPRDIEFLAKNKPARIAFLQTVKRKSVMVAGAIKKENVTFDLTGVIDYGSGFHSKL